MSEKACWRLGVMRLVGTLALVCCFDAQSAEPQSFEMMELRKKSDAFSNCAFLYADTTRAPVALQKETIDSFLVSYRSKRLVKNRDEAKEFAKGPLNIPGLTETRVKEMLISKAEMVGGDFKALLSAQGVFLVEKNLFFWELLSDDSLLVIPHSGQPILLQK